MKLVEEKILLTDLVLYNLQHKKVQNLHKLIIKHNQELLTFMEHPEIEPTNNEAESSTEAERQLRLNVILTKLTFIILFLSKL